MLIAFLKNKTTTDLLPHKSSLINAYNGKMNFGALVLRNPANSMNYIHYPLHNITLYHCSFWNSFLFKIGLQRNKVCLRVLIQEQGNFSLFVSVN